MINPQPAEDSLSCFYNDDEKPLKEQTIKDVYADYTSNGLTYKKVVSLKQRFSESIKTNRRLKYLDFGCGPGLMLYHHKDNWDCYGVDISDAACQNGKMLGLKIANSLDKLSDHKFDVITLFDVIEHLPDPVSFFSMIKEKLNEEGIIFLRLPVINGFLFDRRHPRKWKWVYAPYHLTIFSVRAIKNIAKKSRLKCSIIMDEDMWISPEIIVAKYKEKNLILAKILRRLAKYFPSFVWFFRLFFTSDTIFVELRK
ncbi:MAG: class I SAM-dependent methyltransferase [Candidatus Omnitrophica bacterium]|nr:class I SAM-dependent methyltransferase [Candidatus Omnitrophota bacterium]